MKKKRKNLKKKGNTFVAEKKFDEAIECYNEAIKLNENNPIYFSNLAAVLISKKDYIGAIEASQKAIKLDPKFAKAYGRLGLALFYSGNNEQAKAALLKAIEIDPENSVAKQNLIKVEDEISKEQKKEKTTNKTSNPFGGLGGLGGMEGMDMSKMGEMMQNPEFMSMAMNMMKQPGIKDMVTNMMKNYGGDMLNQNIDENVLKELENYDEYKESEKLQRVVGEIREKGMSALMEYIADDEVQSFFMKVAKEKSGSSNPFSNFFNKN